MKENLILDKSKAFALRIIKLYDYLRKEKKEFVISKQIVRSGMRYRGKCKGSIFSTIQTCFYCQDEHISCRSRRNRILA